MTTWLVLNSIVLVLVCLMIYLIIRQLGLILGRLDPVGARDSGVGPRKGENIISIIDGIGIDGDSSRKHILYIFGSESCSICGAVRKLAQQVGKYWDQSARILLVYDKSRDGDSEDVVELARGCYLTHRRQIRQSLGINIMPYAVLMDPQGVVLGKGLVNQIMHIESLLELTINKH